MSTVAERLAASSGDHYRIERDLGRGGMATVFLAEDIRHHQRVAIKVLHPELAAVLDHDRFLRELELPAKLEHPHIIPLLDFGSEDGLLYYVTLFIEGETLRGRLSRERQLPVPDAVRITTDVADAIDYAHKHHVVHRGLRPEKIFLLDGRPMVGDFGIALALDHAGGMRLAQTGISLGSPLYMAPEQIIGGRSVDHSADIYALGAVTYEMLAGTPPFTGASAHAIVARVVTEKPRALTSIRDTVPRHVDEAVFAALQKLAADRPTTAREFAHALADPHPASSFEFVAAERTNTTSLVAGILLTAALFGIAGYAVGYKTHDFSLRDPEPSQLAILAPDLGGVGRVASQRQIAITPNGKAVVYVAQTETSNTLMYRRLDADAAIPLRKRFELPGPVVSQDGQTGDINSVNPATPIDNAAGEIQYARGHVAFARKDGSIWAAPYDKKRGIMKRTPLQVATRVSLTGTGVAQFALSRSGNLAYIAEEPYRLVLVDRDGKLRNLTSERGWFHSPRFSPDGKYITYTSGQHRTVGVIPAVSPDGKWLAYVSSKSGRQELYLRPVAIQGGEIQVSQHGGAEPVWGRDGKSLYYRALSDDGVYLVEATLTESPRLSIVSRRALFPVYDMVPGDEHANYDVSPDGRTFALVRRSQATRIVVIQNLPAIVRAAGKPD